MPRVEILTISTTDLLPDAAEKVGIGRDATGFADRFISRPTTAHKGLSRWLADLPPVHARCVAVHPIGTSLRVTVHSVQPARSL